MNIILFGPPSAVSNSCRHQVPPLTPAAVRRSAVLTTLHACASLSLNRHSHNLFTRPATLPHPPRSELLLARLLFVGALSGPLPPIPRIAPGSRPQFLGRIQPAPLVVHGITFPGIPCRFSGFSFHRIPRQGSPPRFTDTRRVRSCACLPLFAWVVHFARLGYSTRTDPAPPRIGSAAPGHNPARGPFVSF